MAEKRIIEFNTATPTNNDYFLMDNQQDGCRKVALDGLFGSGKLTVNGASGSQVEVGNTNTIGSTGNAIVVGTNNYVQAPNCIAVGNNLTVGNKDILVLGKYNFAEVNSLITIGNGTGVVPTPEDPRPMLNNLLVLRENGDLEIMGESSNLTIAGDLYFERNRQLSEELDKYKYVTLQNTTIETTDWALEGTPTYEDYPYAANIDVTNIVTSSVEYTADIIPSERMISDGLLFSLVTTTSTAIKVYASNVPSVDYTIPLITLKALRGGTL